MDASLMARMEELDEENKRLKKMYSEKSMQSDLLKEASLDPALTIVTSGEST